MNNHVNSNEILIVLGLNQSHGGTGPTLFSYDKITEEVNNRGPLFPSGHRLSSRSTSGWYFSATRPTTLYINDGSTMLRYDVLTHDSEVVFDVSARFGGDREVWQMSSSNDDLVHAATLRVKGMTSTFLGCTVYLERTGTRLYYPKAGDFDECQIDKSGDLDARGGEANATGAGGTTTKKTPKGNLDVTGRYFIWTTNLDGNRLDAFIVKVPGQLL
jgi:hypothetical protein